MLRPIIRILADGCHLDWETWRAIEEHGFAGLAYQHFRLPVPIISPHIAGVATKAPREGHVVIPSSVLFAPGLAESQTFQSHHEGTKALSERLNGSAFRTARRPARLY